MQTIGKFNAISEELKAEIPSLEERKLVTIKFLNGAANTNPDAEERAKQPVIFPKTCINLKDRIKDPYKKGDNMVEIGLPVEFDEKGNPKSYKMIMPWAGQSPFRGTYHLVDGRGDDNEILEILWLSNENASNPHRNKNVEPLFEVVDTEKAAKKTIKAMDELTKALVLATNMNLTEKKDIAASLNWPFELTDEMLTAKILDLARNEPATFNKLVADPETKMKAVIKQASDNGVIKYDGATSKVLYGATDVVLAVLDKRPGVLWLDLFAEHLMKHKDGDKQFNNIKKQLKSPTQPA